MNPFITINNKDYPCDIRSSHEGIKKGAMGKRVMDKPMVFIFPYSEDRSFWMFNCLIPLDIIFTDNGKVTKIHNNCQPCDKEPCQTYDGYGNMVVELESGFCDANGITEGDALKLHL